MDRIFEKRTASDIELVRPLVSEALSFLNKHIALTDENKNDVRLVLNETLLNAIIHGNNSDAEKFVYLSVTISGSLIIITVMDEGNGFDHKKLLSEFNKQDKKSILESEHGRGVVLAASLMDDFSYNEKGNRLVCSKRVISYE